MTGKRTEFLYIWVGKAGHFAVLVVSFAMLPYRRGILVAQYAGFAPIEKKIIILQTFINYYGINHQ